MSNAVPPFLSGTISTASSNAIGTPTGQIYPSLR